MNNTEKIFFQKVRRSGTSHILTVPATIIEMLDLREGEEARLKIKKVEEDNTGYEFDQVIRKFGSSHSITIPKSVISMLGLKVQDYIQAKIKVNI